MNGLRLLKLSHRKQILYKLKSSEKVHSCLRNKCTICQHSPPHHSKYLLQRNHWKPWILYLNFPEYNVFHQTHQKPLGKMRMETGIIEQQIHTWMKPYKKPILAIKIHFPVGECFSQNTRSLSDLSGLMQERYEIDSKENFEKQNFLCHWILKG